MVNFTPREKNHTIPERGSAKPKIRKATPWTGVNICSARIIVRAPLLLVFSRHHAAYERHYHRVQVGTRNGAKKKPRDVPEASFSESRRFYLTGLPLTGVVAPRHFAALHLSMLLALRLPPRPQVFDGQVTVLSPRCACTGFVSIVVAARAIAAENKRLFIISVSSELTSAGCADGSLLYALQLLARQEKSLCGS
ncbi:MAG: hypothetical protein HYS26_01095 [Candidatus Kaiserbacteria bacterium]|nr:MAG: hypothetical protein HYS26_01095 [Candidatus Kaiserbacteria bacterium]